MNGNKNSVLSIKNLTKNFAEKTAVDNITLSLPPGKIFALLGPNGSGKSTLVKMLTGIIKPTSGDAFILNQSIVTNTDEIKKIIGVLPETLGLFEGLSLWEHLLLAGSIYGVSAEQTAFRAEQLFRHLDLWNLKDSKIETSSFGMKKKCALAMAVLHTPKIVFLDEPFEGIDPLSARNIKNICRLLSKRGTTVFITSHIIEIMERLADSFAVISNGCLQCHFEVEDLHAKGRSMENIYYDFIEDTLTGEMDWLEN